MPQTGASRAEGATASEPVALPPPPYRPVRQEQLAGSRVRVHFAGGRRADAQLAGIDTLLGTISLISDGQQRRYSAGEVTDVLFRDRVDPAAAGETRTVPFELELADGRTLRGRTLGSVRRASDLNLFVRHHGHYHRAWIPVAAIEEERIGEPLGEVLVAGGNTSREQVAAALESQPQSTGGTYRRSGERLGERLQREQGLSDEALAHALAAKLGLPHWEESDLEPQPEAVERIPAAIAQEAMALPLAVHGRHLQVAVRDPTDTEALKRLEFAAGMPLEIGVAPGEALRRKLGSIETDAEHEQVMQELGVDDTDHGKGNAGTDDQTRESAEKLAGQKPIVRLVAQIIRDAINRRASDIHIRPDDERLHLLYRIDGMLIPVQDIARRLLPGLIGRIKILGGMDIAERRAPQDGRTDVEIAGHRVDLRISIMPTVNGESAVLRLLDAEAGVRSVDQLGLSEQDTAIFNDLISREQGMFLVTGPTGSGKSTTLYAGIGEVRRRNVNIITVEDPVEYHMDGIQQIQVLRAAGLTFASALRNILRHDPDVIMIGEIRDAETAKIATESAMTGHLVFSTLHTNSAAGTITRLLQMGVEDYLLPPTLIGIMAQRLVRRNCPECRDTEEVGAHVRKILGATPDERFVRGRGCEHCNETGYAGRLVAYELMRMSDRLRTAIGDHADEAELNRIAAEEGMVRITEHALALARSGETSADEAHRLRID